MEIEIEYWEVLIWCGHYQKVYTFINMSQSTYTVNTWEILIEFSSIFVGIIFPEISCSLEWRHNPNGVSNHRRLDCLLNRLFGRRSKKTSKLRVIGFYDGNSPVNSPHQGPVTRQMFPFDDVIMLLIDDPFLLKQNIFKQEVLQEGILPPSLP